MNKNNQKSRAPHGARGLKLDLGLKYTPIAASRPAWGAWIEIKICRFYMEHGIVAPRMGRVD